MSKDPAKASLLSSEWSPDIWNSLLLAKETTVVTEFVKSISWMFHREPGLIRSHFQIYGMLRRKLAQDTQN